MNIQVFGQLELVERIDNCEGIYSHLVSIGNPGRGIKRIDSIIPSVFKTVFKKYLRLEFYDVLEKRHLGPMRPKRIPLKKDIRKAIRFFNKNTNEATGYTIHCWRGVSRSTAIALGYLYMIYRDEEKTKEPLSKISRSGIRLW